jgi:ferredoxin
MIITKDRYLSINKYALIAVLLVYVMGSFTPWKAINPGLIFAIGAGFFLMFQQKYFFGRTKLAAHIWLAPFLISCITYTIPLQKDGADNAFGTWIVTAIITFVPFVLLIAGKPKTKASRKKRLKIINARIIVQISTVMIYSIVTSVALIRGNRYDLAYWAAFHILTTGLTPFLFGRVLCSWVCPNSLLQDGLLKYLKFKRPIPTLPKAIEEQTNTCAMNISGEVDKSAPLLPATLLICWFPMFFCETVFDLVAEFWYPVGFMYGLFFLSFIFSWRKVCAHFCWLSSYRAIGGHGSIWRIRFNKNKCERCKKCKPTEECPMFINVREQDNEMPASCATCFQCMENCPFDGVITYRRAKEEKIRLKNLGKVA